MAAVLPRHQAPDAKALTDEQRLSAGSSPSCSENSYQNIQEVALGGEQLGVWRDSVDNGGNTEKTAADHQGHAASTAEAVRQRREHIGPNHALMYSEPLHIVRGEATTLWAADGSSYLDAANNVAHVGHCNRKVCTAVAEQMATLNTNSRYLHSNFGSLAEQLTATMPAPLDIMYATCSGSESNDLALQIARANSPNDAFHVLVVDGAYSGHTTATLGLSPYKFNGPGGSGKPQNVHIMPCPDTLRGLHLDGRASARAAIAEAHAAGGHVCAFFSESILSCGGQVVLPPGFLAAVYEEMRAEGAVCIADEVQCGFGRVGSHFWAFETQDVVPDIVTLGKPIGNGFPMGAVVTSKKLAAGFDNGMTYFATCGGCTASGAAGLAVLRVLAEEGLQAQAADTGPYLMAQLRRLQQGRPFLGDVRGLGLMIGIECISDDRTQAHAPNIASWIKEQMKLRHVLVTTDGARCDNIIKIKPPMTFCRKDADRLVAQLEYVLQLFDALPQEQQKELLQPWYLPAVTAKGVPAAKKQRTI